MYRLPGVRSGAWLTEEEVYEPPKGINNYGLMPATYKNEGEQWEKTKEEFKRDFQKLLKNAVTASKRAKDAIKKAYDWAGMWGVSALGSAGGLAYVCSQHPGDEYSWLKGLLGAALVGSLTKIYHRVERRREERRREILERRKIKIQREIRDMLKEIVKTPANGQLIMKINYKGRLETLLKKLEKEKEMEWEEIEQIKNKEIKLIKSGMEKLYRI